MNDTRTSMQHVVCDNTSAYITCFNACISCFSLIILIVKDISLLFLFEMYFTMFEIESIHALEEFQTSVLIIAFLIDFLYTEPRSVRMNELEFST